VSSYANTTVRIGKPFNPLLGETYECDRLSELGWRSFTEQVIVASSIALSLSVSLSLSVCLSVCECD